MSLWMMLGVIMLAGAAGGLLNAYFTDNGFVWPRVESVGTFTITRPGFLGSMLVGGVAAAVSWGLYGPFAGMSIFGSTDGIRPSAALTVSALVGAVLVGIGGGRWLTDQADKSLLKATAAHAAQGKANPEASAAIAASRPAAALESLGSSDAFMAANVGVESDRLRVGPLCFIAFQRTLRIPDDGRTYPLPPGLGRLPIRPHAPPYGRPSQFLVPLRRREAVWLAFDAPAWRPHAVLIGLGRVNAVTGGPWSPILASHPQNYLVCPPQLWLDGVKVADDRVRQFVATPLDTGTTIESQLSDQPEEGTIRIVVFEPHAGRFPDQAPPAEPPSRLRAPGTMGLGAGGAVRQRVYADPHGIETWNAEDQASVELRLATPAEFTALTGEAAPPTPIDASVYTSHGLPWFELYDDAAADLPATPEMEGVRSADELSGHVEPDGSIDIPESQIDRLGRRKNDLGGHFSRDPFEK